MYHFIRKGLIALVASLLVFIQVIPIMPVKAAEAPVVKELPVPTIDQDVAESIRVKNAKPGATIQLFRSNDPKDTPAATTVASELGVATIDKIGGVPLTPGNDYFIRQVVFDTDGTTIIEESKFTGNVPVKPKVPTIEVPPSSYNITVSNLYPNYEKITLYDYNKKIFDYPGSGKVGESGYQFTDLPPGVYYVTQTVNGQESPLALAFNQPATIKPPVPKKENINVSGTTETGNSGSIRVINEPTTAGETFILYECLTDSSCKKTAATYPFTGLKAGLYKISRLLNGAESDLSDLLTVKDEKPSTINVGDVLRVKVGDPLSRTELMKGVSIDDFTLTQEQKTQLLTGKTNTGQDTNAKIEILGIDGWIKNEQAFIPGEYEITYKISSSTYQSFGLDKKDAIAKRLVIVEPPKVEISALHTTEAAQIRGTDPTEYGLIYVNASAIFKSEDPNIETVLELYRKDTNTLVQSFTYQSNGNYIRDGKGNIVAFENVDVPGNYYVVQRVNKIPSEPSNIVDVKDNTKPVLELKGEQQITITLGSPYFDDGATAFDNKDGNITSNIVTTIIRKKDGKKLDAVDTTVPGIYTIRYTVKDAAGNEADPIERQVIVQPPAVKIYGSSASIGEISVKQAIPNATLYLYKVDPTDPNKLPDREYAKGTLKNDETTYAFNEKTIGKKVEPGFYVVIQVPPGFTLGDNIKSALSNIAEVTENDLPIIHRFGDANIKVTLGEKVDGLFEDKAGVWTFIDPGVEATDYLDGNVTNLLTVKVNGKTICGMNDDPTQPCTKEDKVYKQLIPMNAPGVYTITYNVTVRGTTKANEVKRTVTVLPPTLKAVTGSEGITAGKSQVTAPGLYNHKQNTIKLYDSTGKLLDQKTVDTSANPSVIFSKVPAGRGYYVTQTVNGVESAPSNYINVILFEEPVGVMSLTISDQYGNRYLGAINPKNNVITVYIPNGTDITKLKPSVQKMPSTATEIYNPGLTSGYLNISKIDDPITYTLTHNGKVQNYIIQLKRLNNNVTDSFKNTVKQNITISDNTTMISPNPNDWWQAMDKGMSFVSSQVNIHVPKEVAKQTAMPYLKVQTKSANSLPSKWSNSITTDAIEFSWARQQGAFASPMELEFPATPNKTVVKLVNVDGKTYALQRPVRKTNTSIIAMAPQFSTYALMNDSDVPPSVMAIKLNEDSDTTTYRLYQAFNVSGLYYTTDSSLVTPLKSATVSSKDDAQYNQFYGFKNDEPRLEKWNEGKNFVDVTVKKGESLYAVYVKNDVFGPISKIHEPTVKKWNTQTGVERSKVWTLSFNQPVDKNTIRQNFLGVRNQMGEDVPVTYRLSDDEKKVYIAPQEGYESGQTYTLWASQDITSKTNQKLLRQPLEKQFTIK